MPEGDTFKVFVVDSAGIAHEQEVKVGAQTPTASRSSKGFTAGERIVTFGAYGMEDSAKVVPLDAGKKPAKPDSAEKP